MPSLKEGFFKQFLYDLLSTFGLHFIVLLYICFMYFYIVSLVETRDTKGCEKA